MRVSFFLKLLFLLTLMSCATQKNSNTIKENRDNILYNKALLYITNDASFRKSLNKSYLDLKECKEISFTTASYTRPMSINFFQKEELVHTSYFSKYSELNYLAFEEVKKQYDTTSKMDSELIEFNKIDSIDNCKILLTFSNISKKILLVEYKVIDKNVDPRIVYNPRKGYYLIEFNERQEIIKHIYKILNR